MMETDIILYQIDERFRSQAAVYREILGISAQSWDRVKKGQRTLSRESLGLLSTVFTPYEWYLGETASRLYQGIGVDPVMEYRIIRTRQAGTWGLDPDTQVTVLWGETIPVPGFRPGIYLRVSRLGAVSGYRDDIVLPLSESHYRQWLTDPERVYQRWAKEGTA